MSDNIDFKNFILKYTFVNSKFVKDFYNIISEDYLDRSEDFLIDSEILRKWLKIKNRRTFNKTIKKSYTLELDYIIQKSQRDKLGKGGQTFETIILTPEAAKEICLCTKSKVGDQVRKYFIDIERALHRYHKHIIFSMDKKIKQMENNQRPKVNAKKGIIYIFRALNTDIDLYKIGRTINKKSRFNSHNSPLANDLEIIFTYETDDVEHVESCVKNFMKKRTIS